MELFKAHQQWANRPKDERFATLLVLYQATLAYAQTAREKTVSYADIRAEAIQGDVQLVGKQGTPAQLTHWAFGQLAARVGAPAAYLRNLPATLAVQNLNHGLAKLESGNTAQLLFHQNGNLLLRALTSDSYARIWNWEVVQRLMDMTGQGWEPAVPDFNTFGDAAPSLYASDHDMFVFLRSKNVDIAEPGADQPIYRGIIVENSEVGAAALKLTRFLYRAMCGNHIIWGASKVIDLSIRHVGQARNKWGTIAMEIRAYADESTGRESDMIAKAQTRTLAVNKDELLDLLFGKRSLGLSRKVLEAGYDAVLPAQDGDPLSAWGIVQGLTRYSQTLGVADKRTDIDRAAGKILEATF